MKKQIEATLAVLVGQAMCGSHRAADMEMFEFGNPPSGSSGMSVAHTIHIRCPWRLTAAGVIVTGYDDVRYPTGSNPLVEPRGFQWDAPGANRRDERLQIFFDRQRARPPLVTTVEADDLGSLRLAFDQNVRLELFPDDSLDDVTDSERWRFFQPGTDGSHFLVTGGGCDTVVG